MKALIIGSHNDEDVDMLTSPDYSKPLAVITGGASGLGLELGRAFAKNGFDLIVASDETGLEQAALGFQAIGARTIAVAVDLSAPAGVDMLVRRVEAEGRPVDALVVNAGVGLSGDFAGQTAWAAELNMINLNITSAVHLCKHIVPKMLDRSRGKILFTSSLSAVSGPHSSVYSATRSFVQSFAEALRGELKNSGVSVTALVPGVADVLASVAAHQAFDGLMAGEGIVVAGYLKSKVAAMAKVFPQLSTNSLQRRSTEPGSALH